MIALAPNPSWLEGVEYDGLARRHRLDGRPVPSVTQALSLAYPDRFARVPPATLAHKAAIGTAVHQAAQYHAERDLANGPLIPDVFVRVEAWKWFCATRQVEPLLCEAVVCSRDRALRLARRRPYVGKLDFLCIVDRNTLVLLDIKTGIPSLAAQQTIAYLDALYQQYPELIALDVHRWAVVLNGAGKYQVHAFRADARDAMSFRQTLDQAYEALAQEWSMETQRPSELPMDLPDEEVPTLPVFDIPEDVPGGVFELPDEAPPPAAAQFQHVPEGVIAFREDVPGANTQGRTLAEARSNLEEATALVLEADVPAIRELRISPDVETYLAMLEAAIAPYEATAKAFAAQMEQLPIDTPSQLQALGQQSLVAKEREKLLNELFEPAIEPPRQYLDRVYGLKRRVLSWIKTGGDTAARRYTARKRELEDADRKAQMDAARRQREAEREAEQVAATERRRLAQEAAQAAQAGKAAEAAELIEQARAVEAAPVPVELPPQELAAGAAVSGISERGSWTGDITDLKVAVLASARPDIYREIAAAIEAGDLTVGGSTLTTQMIASRLRALASDLPIIPSAMFAGNEKELKARAAADRDTLQWPGFTFAQVFTPVRRTGARTARTTNP